MKITDDHWLEGATRILIKGGSPMNIRRFLVMHFTAGATALSSIRFWQTPAAQGASAHLVIDRDGTIYQCRPFNVTCGHAGVSSWVDPNTGKKYTGLNSCSIGIELANAGDNVTLAKKWSELPLAKNKHKNGGPVKEWEVYPVDQLMACKAASQAIVKRYNIDDLIGHEDIAPTRKNDPGPAFPMALMRGYCGFPPDIQKR